MNNANKSYSKLLGIICLSVSIIMTVGFIDGRNASGAIAISKLFGEPPYFAASLTIVLIVMGLFFGLRALVWNKVCIGD